MMTKIVHHIRDCVGIIAGVQHTDRPLQVKYWGVRTPATPATLTPIYGLFVTSRVDRIDRVDVDFVASVYET